MNIALIIPTCNAAGHWQALLEGIRRQSLQPRRIIVIDSGSADGTAALACAAGFTVIRIDRSSFRHGATRQAAAQHAGCSQILIYLTQDAILHGTDSIRALATAFQDPMIGAAYGRQLPRKGASAIESHARLFNYPAASRVRSWESRSSLGFKSIFFSNAFGAYRRDALASIGGFSPRVSFGEDTLAVAQLHRAGWKTAYVADALVEHSHPYTLYDEFRRYLEIGTLHRHEHWLIEQFGATSGEGLRFVVSELRYLVRRAPFEIPSALLRTAAKYLAYQAGRHELSLTPWIKYGSAANSAR